MCPSPGDNWRGTCRIVRPGRAANALPGRWAGGGLAAGRPQRAMAEEAKVSQGHIDKMLRYHRFLNSAEFKIPEFRFRQ